MFERISKALRGDKDGATAHRVTDGVRVYAIGDIHGRADLLSELHALIGKDAGASAADRRVIVYLGDYVDRGLQSREVIEILLAGPPDGFDAVHLLGNHEALMLEFLDQDEPGLNWLYNGGNATLYSYGVALPSDLIDENSLLQIRRQLRENLPDTHRQFLKGLQQTHRDGDYLFVHAGIRPGVALSRQSPDDLIWIRETFTESKEDHGVMVVHGHTITTDVDERANRIGIDTGAYATGRLTCLVLHGEARQYLNT